MIDDCIIEIFKKCNIYTKLNIIKTNKKFTKLISETDFERKIEEKCINLLFDPVNDMIFVKQINYIIKFLNKFNLKSYYLNNKTFKIEIYKKCLNVFYVGETNRELNIITYNFENYSFWRNETDLIYSKIILPRIYNSII